MSMKKLAIMTMALALATGALADNVQGAWSGNLNLGVASLRIVINIDKDKASLDSPDQGAYGIGATLKYCSADSVAIEIPALQAGYTARLTGGVLKGTFTQAGQAMALDLKPGGVDLKRPQTPKPPFDYTSEEVKITTPGTDPSTGKALAAGGAQLAGTLLIPAHFAKGGTVVVMVSGSGQQNRDEELFGHKPFWVIADRLAHHGIASLRYDDRGVGGSTGQVKGATTYDNMSDALAVVEYLRKQGRFGKIGILGHSEGGTIAYMIAARKKADFVVSLAGPALRGDSILVMQNRDMLRAAGVDSATVSAYCTALSRILAYKRTARMEANPELTLATLTIGLELPEPLKANLIEVIKSHDAWTDYFAAYDPSADVSHTTCPVMAVGGSRDLQVNTQANLQAVNRLLPHPTGNGKWARYHFVKEYQGLNHLLQPATTGMPTEYGQIETTLSEEVLTDLCQWLSELR